MTTSAPSRKKPATTASRSQEAGQLAPRRRLDPRRHRRRRDVAPFLWMLRTALSSNASLASNASNLLPADFSLGAFKRVLGLQSPEEAIAEGGSGAAINFWLYLRNSVIFATVTTAGQVFFSAMAAYAFSRLRWPGRNVVFGLFLATMMVPPIFTALPNFLMIKNLGLLNTFAGLALPFLFMTPFAIFFLRQFFLSMSREVEEAAMLDGAKHVRIFFQIVLPERRGPAGHPGAADLHRPVERVLLAAAGGPGRKRPRPHRGPGRLQVPVPAGRPRLVRPDGRHPDRGPARPPALHRLRQAGGQLHRLLRHQVTPAQPAVPFNAPPVNKHSPQRSTSMKGPP